MTEAPKFLDVKKKRVVEGVKIRKTPTPFADILGTYVWVYSGDPQFGGDVEEMHRSSCKDDTEFITKHSVTLGADSSRPVVPKKVTGQVTWGTAKVVFNGVRRVRTGWSSDAAVPWMKSYWEVLLTENYEDEEGPEWLDMEGNALGVAEVLDDNGSPFLVFDWSHPPGCHSSWSGYYVGKRLAEGKDWRLTHEEQGRLGIGRSVAQFLKESVKVEEVKVEAVEEVKVEEANVEVKTEELKERVKEEEVKLEVKAEEGKVEVKEEEVKLEEDVGEKRKASDGGTSTKKRRRA